MKKTIIVMIVLTLSLLATSTERNYKECKRDNTQFSKFFTQGGNHWKHKDHVLAKYYFTLAKSSAIDLLSSCKDIIPHKDLEAQINDVDNLIKKTSTLIEMDRKD